MSFLQPVLKLVFGATSTDGLTMFFVRHWGALLFVVCALTVYCAYVPVTRPSILTASIIEKIVIVTLQRTRRGCEQCSGKCSPLSQMEPRRPFSCVGQRLARVQPRTRISQRHLLEA